MFVPVCDCVWQLNFRRNKDRGRIRIKTKMKSYDISESSQVWLSLLTSEERQRFTRKKMKLYCWDILCMYISTYYSQLNWCTGFFILRLIWRAKRKMWFVRKQKEILHKDMYIPFKNKKPSQVWRCKMYSTTAIIYPLSRKQISLLLWVYTTFGVVQLAYFCICCTFDDDKTNFIYIPFPKSSWMIRMMIIIIVNSSLQLILPFLLLEQKS